MAWNHYQRIMATPYPCIFQISHEWLLLEYIKRNPAGNEAWEVCFSDFTSLGYMRKHRIAGWWLFIKSNITLADANWLYFYYLFYTCILAFMYKEELSLPHPITISVNNHELFLKSSLWKFISHYSFWFQNCAKIKNKSQLLCLFELLPFVHEHFFVFWKNKVFHPHFVLSLYQTWAM